MLAPHKVSISIAVPT
uniref:Uncharacterized protein n=1 Tax=Anguilla anguilla TaxID=7936 RepID=A0A0E9T0N4_ANGAN